MRTYNVSCTCLAHIDYLGVYQLMHFTCQDYTDRTALIKLTRHFISLKHLVICSFVLSCRLAELSCDQC